MVSPCCSRRLDISVTVTCHAGVSLARAPARGARTWGAVRAHLARPKAARSIAWQAQGYGSGTPLH
jgi:hypothetical protein